MTVNSFGFTTLILYLLSTLHYLLFLITKKDKIATVGLYASRIGFLTNLLFLTALIYTKGTAVLFTPKGVFALLSISTISVFLYFSTKYKLHISGAFLTPWAALFAGIATFSKGIPKDMFPIGIIGTIHIFSALTGYAAFMFSTIVSILYIILERQLKKKKFSVFYHKIPSLKLLENIIYSSISFGFMFITISMFTGAIWSAKLFGTYWSWDPKQVLTLITWFIYAAILHLYVTGKWNGKKLCYLSIGGTALVMINFIGVNIAFKGVHSF
ncbi:cytochrome C assembly family protein [Desulfurobacterium atlanticum]|uniref:Heme exporter protein C n=1 Tax=Desulfurobacterium atlanticum TaxID=240169 RepID=A0A238XSR0_9BACT|nr:cytochrome c biogenesis protein CcsA [Desulfurobacterium atlanticum]SNR62025.1 cytochrome c-type biogenesis protein CcsB [Desulfurobacterium atlanticum]